MTLTTPDVLGLLGVGVLLLILIWWFRDPTIRAPVGLEPDTREIPREGARRAVIENILTRHRRGEKLKPYEWQLLADEPAVDLEELDNDDA